MKKLSLLLPLIPCAFFFACDPDPNCSKDVIAIGAVTWDANEKTVTVMVRNNGIQDTGPFMVYVNADEQPESQNHRPQVRHQVPNIPPGGLINLPLSDFTPLSHPDNFNLGNVRSITVLADPKGQVEECLPNGETNNSQTIPLP